MDDIENQKIAITLKSFQLPRLISGHGHKCASHERTTQFPMEKTPQSVLKSHDRHYNTHEQ